MTRPRSDVIAKALVIVVGVALAVPVSGSATEPTRIEHYAPVPCSLACSYHDAATAAGFDVCSNDFPPGSFDRTTLRMTQQTGIVHIETWAEIDYDTFICTSTTPSRQVFAGISDYGEQDCKHRVRDSNIAGCPEFTDITWNALQAAAGKPTEQFVVVSYNWFDYAPLPITITGPAEIVDDTYEASPL